MVFSGVRTSSDAPVSHSVPALRGWSDLIAGGSIAKARFFKFKIMGIARQHLRSTGRNAVQPPKDGEGQDQQNKWYHNTIHALVLRALCRPYQGLVCNSAWGQAPCRRLPDLLDHRARSRWFALQN